MNVKQKQVKPLASSDDVWQGFLTDIKADCLRSDCE